MMNLILIFEIELYNKSGTRSASMNIVAYILVVPFQYQVPGPTASINPHWSYITLLIALIRVGQGVSI